ncbi:MAG: hypothetical protein R2685_10585 [Candidatus Nitrosocosmicus sp.]|nr:hypothetical protein [Candidatus Nitrosocosmicus sp.]
MKLPQFITQFCCSITWHSLTDDEEDRLYREDIIWSKCSKCGISICAQVADDKYYTIELA